MKNASLCAVSTFLLLISPLCRGQITVHQTGIRHTIRIDDTTPITNAETGKPITLKEYNELISGDRYGYHLIPEYDAYGQPSAYTMRKATAEERENKGIRDRDSSKQPKVGKPMPVFAMTGMDKKVYRSADLVGRAVVLCFLVNLQKPFWDDKYAARLANALLPYKAENGPVVLGVMDDEVAISDVNVMPFIPVLNAHGFHGKYHITVIPTFIVLDKQGNVAALLEGMVAFDRLKQVLAAVTR